MSQSLILIAVVGVVVGAATALFLKRRTWWRRYSLSSALVGVAVGALTAAGVGLVLTGQSSAVSTNANEVFRSVPVPGIAPPGLTDVRLQDSPTNGLELYVQEGTVSVFVCYATPDQLAVGSCATENVSLIREEPAADGGVRVLRIVRFQGPEEEEAKADRTSAASAVLEFWKAAELYVDPPWLRSWLS